MAGLRGSFRNFLDDWFRVVIPYSLGDELVFNGGHGLNTWIFEGIG